MGTKYVKMIIDPMDSDTDINDRTKGKLGGVSLSNRVIAILLIMFSISIIIMYCRMLHNEIPSNINKSEPAERKRE